MNDNDTIYGGPGFDTCDDSAGFDIELDSEL